MMAASIPVATRRNLHVRKPMPLKCPNRLAVDSVTRRRALFAKRYSWGEMHRAYVSAAQYCVYKQIQYVSELVDFPSLSAWSARIPK